MGININIFPEFQTSTNVLLIMVAVTTYVSTNQDHLNVNVKKDIFWVMMERLALVNFYTKIKIISMYMINFTHTRYLFSPL